jgi:hypothetical protein
MHKLLHIKNMYASNICDHVPIKSGSNLLILIFSKHQKKKPRRVYETIARSIKLFHDVTSVIRERSFFGNMFPPYRSAQQRVMLLSRLLSMLVRRSR